jgi:hypothetical protein
MKSGRILPTTPMLPSLKTHLQGFLRQTKCGIHRFDPLVLYLASVCVINPDKGPKWTSITLLWILTVKVT